MTSTWDPYGPHVEVMLLSNSWGMAISATFAEDGMEPETCHLWFTALSLKTCKCVCMHLCVCLCACMCISMHEGKGKSYQGTCYTAGNRTVSPRLVCLCVCVHVHMRVCKGGCAGYSGGILCVIRGTAASKCMRLLVINVSTFPLGMLMYSKMQMPFSSKPLSCIIWVNERSCIQWWSDGNLLEECHTASWENQFPRTVTGTSDCTTAGIWIP